jgi:GTP-binding protein EngB required for normal cell division
MDLRRFANDVRQRVDKGIANNKYRRALQLCAKTAHEEYDHACKVLVRTQEVINNLQQRMKVVGDNSSQLSGTATDSAHASLISLNRTLNALASDKFAETTKALTGKKTRLEKFSVTLFGRTMAGKSTIREAITQGDGSTIGKGGQRMTRDVREYEWNHLRIIDTPGIGAYEGDEDRERALSLVNESDLFLFLVSSDGIQESSFQAMRELRDQNKPIIFVLNVKKDLTKDVFRRKFLQASDTVFGDDVIDGHMKRIKHLASVELGMRNIRVVVIHAQAAFMATQEKDPALRKALHEASGIEQLMHDLTCEVLSYGPVRRLQTLLDGTALHLLSLEASLLNEAEQLKGSAQLLWGKFSELDLWFEGHVGTAEKRIEHRVRKWLKPLRASASTFIDENLERGDVGERWKKKVKSVGIEKQVRRLQEDLLDEVRTRLDEFRREIAVEVELLEALTINGPKQYNPWDVKRTLRWASTGGGAIARVLLSWTPVGWIIGVSFVALALSWFFGNREAQLQRQKASVTAELRKQLNEIEQHTVKQVKAWFHDTIRGQLVHGTRQETQQLCIGMFELSKAFSAAGKSWVGPQGIVVTLQSPSGPHKIALGA